MSSLMLEKNPLFHAAAVQSAERVPSGLQAPLTGSYTVQRLCSLGFYGALEICILLLLLLY